MKELIEKYITLREAKDKIKREAKEKTDRIDAVLDKMEGAILEEFQTTGVDSVKTAAGTAYRSTRTSATVADWDTVLAWVRQNDQWHMLERRVSKDAVVQFREANDDLPPGVNWREEQVVNVRRSN